MSGRGRFRRRDLGPLATAALVSLLVRPPLLAWCQDAGGTNAPGGMAPPPAPRKRPTAVDLALEWLARHQDADGRWNADGFTSRCSGAVCDGPGHVTADVRATGLALSAFLGCGESHQVGDHQVTVKEGLKYLRAVQSDDGEFGPHVSSRWLPNHLAAADAMVQVHGLTQSMLFRDAAVRGIGFLQSVLDHRNGFRSPVRDVPPDVETLAEAALVLRSARAAELPIDPAGLDAIAAWFAERTDPKTGAVLPDDANAKPDSLDDDDRATRGGLVRVWAPADAAALRKDDVILRLADRLAAKPPLWAPSPKGRMRFGAWMRRSQFLQQAHGEKHVAWCRSLDKLLVERQRTDGCAKGSWDPVDVDGAERGRVEATALCATALMWPYQWGWRMKPPDPATDGAPPTPSPSPPPSPPAGK